MLKKFRCYQSSVEFFHQTQALPLSSHLKDQMHRAASSVCLNLAEGAGKTSLNDRRRYYTTALASLRECQAVLDLARVRDERLHQSADRLGGMLYKLCHWMP